MSSRLYFFPVIMREETPLSTELKFALKKWVGTDNIHLILSEKDLNFLVGLSCAGIQDADVLREAITKYGAVEIKEAW